MKAMISDDDARILKAERNGASSFLSLRADFKTAAELRLAVSFISTRVLNRSFPQAIHSIPLVDMFIVAEGPKSFRLSSSFKSSLNCRSVGATSLGRNDFPNPETALPLNSTVDNDN